MYDNESFNPRAPCGARPQRMSEMQIRYLFQSTRPVWGATLWHLGNHRLICGFNPRAPCGARRLMLRMVRRGQRFQSTRPVWGATQYADALEKMVGDVSIHAPRVGRDLEYGY